MNKDKRDLRLQPNSRPVTVEFAFDDPISFDDKKRPGRQRYVYTLKVLDDPTGNYNTGEEVGFFTSDEGLVEDMSAFGRGDRAKLQSMMGAGDRSATVHVLPEDPLSDPEAIWELEEDEEEGKGDPRKPEAGSHLYPDENPEILEMMTRCGMAAHNVRQGLIENGVDESVLGEYFLTKTTLTIWMQVK